MKLGQKPETGSELKATAQVEAPKEYFPGFSLNDKLVDEFLNEHDAKIGEEFTATVRLKTTRLSMESYGKSIGFDMLELNDISEKKFEDKSGEEQFAQLRGEAEAMDGGKRED